MKPFKDRKPLKLSEDEHRALAKIAEYNRLLDIFHPMNLIDRALAFKAAGFDLLALANCCDWLTSNDCSNLIPQIIYHDLTGYNDPFFDPRSSSYANSSVR